MAIPTRCQAMGSALFAPLNIEKCKSDDHLTQFRQTRFLYLRQLRKSIRTLIVFFALLTAITHDPVSLVFGERKEEDFGIGYTMGVVFSWVYMCIFMVFWKTFFSWWVPEIKSGSCSDKALEKVSSFLKDFNMILLPIVAGMCLFQWACSVISILAGFNMPARKSSQFKYYLAMPWAVTLALLVGSYVFQVLEESKLARVTNTEYYAIIMPIQVNIGIAIGSAIQYKLEAKAIKNAQLKLDEETVFVDEKQALLEV